MKNGNKRAVAQRFIKGERGKYAALFKRGARVTIKSKDGDETFLVKRVDPHTMVWKRLPRK